MICRKLLILPSKCYLGYVANDFSLREVQVISKRFAGHSKWKNIQHIKAAKDAEKSAVFSRVGYQIKSIIRDTGNSDPKSNPKLAQAIELGRAANMPIDRINDALKKALGSKDDSKLHIVELRAGNVQILVEFLTNKFVHVKNLMNTILKKHGARVAENGFCLKNFSLKGIIYTKPHTANDFEMALEHAIDIGAEEVSEVEEADGKQLKFLTHPNDIGHIKNELSNKGYVIVEAKIEYVPSELVELTDDEMPALLTLVQKLQKCEDVNKVYDNVK